MLPLLTHLGLCDALQFVKTLWPLYRWEGETEAIGRANGVQEKTMLRTGTVENVSSHSFAPCWASEAWVAHMMSTAVAAFGPWFCTVRSFVEIATRVHVIHSSHSLVIGKHKRVQMSKETKFAGKIPSLVCSPANFPFHQSLVVSVFSST
jgi:hypothetical protein